MRTEETDLFIAHLAQLPGITPERAVRQGHAMIRLARAYGRLCEKECNEPMTSADTARMGTLAEKICLVAGALGLVKATFQSDPRGYTVRVHFPGENPPFNTWGGVSSGFGVPGS